VIAPLSSMALNSNFTKSLIKQSSNGKFTTRMYVKGNYYNVDVDSTVPMFKSIDNSLVIMAEGLNNTMWGPLLEKSYAKFVGTYWSLATGGVSSESMRAITGWPGFLYTTINTTNYFNIIK
jgi:hypothetical protein